MSTTTPLRTGGEKSSVSPTTVHNTTVEPKKSARLAEKRKLREEAGCLSTSDDDPYAFTYKSPSSSSSTSPVKNVSPVYAVSSRSNTPNLRSNSPFSKQGTSTSCSEQVPFKGRTSPRNKSVSPSPSPSKSPVTITSPSLMRASPLTALRSYAAAQSKSPVKSSSPLSVEMFSTGNVTPSKSPSKRRQGSSSTTTSSSSSITKFTHSSSSSLSPKIDSIDDLEMEEDKWLEAVEVDNIEDLSDSTEDVGVLKNTFSTTVSQRRSTLRNVSNRFDSSQSGEISEKVSKDEIPSSVGQRGFLSIQKKLTEPKPMPIPMENSRPIAKPNALIKPKPIKVTTTSYIRYHNNPQRITITFPDSQLVPFGNLQHKRMPSDAIKCGVTNCENIKKYSCSKTGVPLCSLACYKVNLLAHPEIACMNEPV